MNNEELVMKAKAGDKAAKDKLILNNMKLIYKIANKYIGQIEYEDAVQEGVIGMIKAIDHYDESKGTKFTTCAWYWIQKAIVDAAAKDSVIPVNHTTAFEIAKLKRAKEELTKDLGREPSAEELEAETKIKASRIPALLGRPVEVISYNTKIYDDDDDEYIDIIPAPDKVDRERMQKAIRYALTLLDPVEADILAGAFAMHGFKEGAYKMSEKCGVSHQAVNNIRQTALRKLRHPDAVDALKTILEGGEINE